MNPIIKSKLQAILHEIKETHYTNPKSVSDSQAIGILMAKYFEWDGLEILKATFEGLEDSNFHSENEVILQMIHKLER